MNIKSKVSKTFIRFTAYLIKSKKHGIPQSRQKTWRIMRPAQESEMLNIKVMVKCEAERWRAKKMREFYPSGAPSNLTQEEITYEPDAAS